jgi:copper(I)-binding protein
LAALLAACGAGQITQTDTQVAAVNGANGSAGAIAVRDAQLAFPNNAQGVYPPGSTASLLVTIVNTGITPDELLKITTPAADAVTIDGSPTGTKVIPGPYSISSGTDPDDQSSSTRAGTSSSSTASGTPTATSTSPSTATTPKSVPSTTVTTTMPSTTAGIPAVGRVSIMLVGIKSINGAPLGTGLTVPITFYFAHGGQVTLDVPIAPPADNFTPSSATGGTQP